MNHTQVLRQHRVERGYHIHLIDILFYSAEKIVKVEATQTTMQESTVPD